jgi:elongation factor Ts
MSEDTKAVGAGVVKELRDRTGAGMMDCKKALEESGGNIDKAIEFLRIKGLSKAAKKAEREANEGLVLSYIHPGNRIGVLIEVNCETDFVARTDEFQTLVRNLAMHVAAASPLGVHKEDISGDLLEKEKEVFKAQALEEGKPAAVVEKIVAGRIEKFYAEAALMEQVYVRDNEKRVKDLVNEAIAKLGENIKVARFARFQLGQ